VKLADGFGSEGGSQFEADEIARLEQELAEAQEKDRTRNVAEGRAIAATYNREHGTAGA